MAVLGICISLLACCAWQIVVGKKSITDDDVNSEASPAYDDDDVTKATEEKNISITSKVLNKIFDRPYVVVGLLYVVVAVQHFARWQYASGETVLLQINNPRYSNDFALLLFTL